MTNPNAPSPSRPLRVVQVGAGSMGHGWLCAIRNFESVELVGVVDLFEDAARSAVEQTGHTGVPVGTDLAAMLTATQPDAVINVTIPEAHLSVNREALRFGVPVLCEKPASPTVAEALVMAAHSERAGQTLMISQSRRYYPELEEFRRQASTLGTIGSLTHNFFKAPHFGGFREEMDHVLLVDMAIHPFDVARYLLDSEPVSVYCEEFNPSYSWFSGAASVMAIFTFASGVKFSYAGSWSAPGFETSWNGSWRISGHHGSALWDGDNLPEIDLPDSTGAPSADASEVDRAVPQGIDASLREFVASLHEQTLPSNHIHSNILSLAMVEAAVQSAQAGHRVLISDVIENARAQAITEELDPEIRTLLATIKAG